MTSLRVQAGPSGATTWAQLVDHYTLETIVPSGVLDGWVPLVDEVLWELQGSGFFDAGGKVAQAKEKFGVLRIYLEPPGDTADITRDSWIRIARWAEDQSQTVCEWCGRQPASRVYLTQPDGWLKTLCSEPCRQEVFRFHEALRGEYGREFALVRRLVELSMEARRLWSELERDRSSAALVEVIRLAARIRSLVDWEQADQLADAVSNAGLSAGPQLIAFTEAARARIERGQFSEMSKDV